MLLGALAGAFPGAIRAERIADLRESPDGETETAAAACASDATTLCVNSNRFKVTAIWRSADANGNGQAVKLTDDSGYFWFFTPSNVEMIVKALNGCAFNNRYWIFAGGLTNVQVTITVTDTQTGAVKTYSNPLNTAFAPIQDTSAFASCP